MEIEKLRELIDCAFETLNIHRSADRQIEALMANTRISALLDAYKALGGDTSEWKKDCGVINRRK